MKFRKIDSFFKKRTCEDERDEEIITPTTRFGRSRLEENQVTIEHYFRVEIFFSAIDKQLQELNSRFCEQSMELLTLRCVLTPKNNYKAFKVETICTLVEKYYPMDFNEQDQILLRLQLRHFIVDARETSNLKNLSTIQELCSCLVETEKAKIYYLIDRLLRLILTLPVSTATTERSFSAMKIIKNKLRNKMKAEFLADSMSVYIEREIAATISWDTIIDEFKALATRNASF
jgi:hypothetical protein